MHIFGIAGWSGSASMGEPGRIHAATGRWPFSGEIGSMGHLLTGESPNLSLCPDYLRPLVAALQRHGARVSLFVEDLAVPDLSVSDMPFRLSMAATKCTPALVTHPTQRVLNADAALWRPMRLKA